MSDTKGNRYLFWCANEHPNFRIPEFESLVHVFKISAAWIEKNQERPWVILDLKSEDEAKKIFSRLSRS